MNEVAQDFADSRTEIVVSALPAAADDKKPKAGGGAGAAGGCAAAAPLAAKAGDERRSSSSDVLRFPAAGSGLGGISDADRKKISEANAARASSAPGAAGSSNSRSALALHRTCILSDGGVGCAGTLLCLRCFDVSSPGEQVKILPHQKVTPCPPPLLHSHSHALHRQHQCFVR